MDHNFFAPIRRGGRARLCALPAAEGFARRKKSKWRAKPPRRKGSPPRRKVKPSRPQCLCACLPQAGLCALARVKNKNSAAADRWIVFFCAHPWARILSRFNEVKSGSPGGTLERIRIVLWTILARGEMVRWQK